MITTSDPPGLLDILALSQNYLLARINMRNTAEPHSETAQPSLVFSPGCGYRECQHCSSVSPPGPPPLPPKPPWLRPPRPLSFSSDNRSDNLPPRLPLVPALAPPTEAVVETSASSETSEQEPVIYSKNVRLGHQEQAGQVGLKGLGRKVIRHKSATVNLENLLLEKYLSEKETKKARLEAEMLGLDERIAGVSARLAAVGTNRELEKYKLHVQDVEKITSLLYSLACRLAKTEDILENVFNDKVLQVKREKLKGQLEEAKYLNSLVNKRGTKVGLILQKYFGESMTKDFKTNIEDKVKIIVELKELDDQVCLTIK